MRLSLTIDLLLRSSAIRQLHRRHGGGLWAIVCLTVLFQALAQGVPFLMWLSWPFLVYLASVLLCGPAVRPASVPLLWLTKLGALRSRLTILISLVLYGVLSVILFTGLSDLIKLLPLATLAATVNLPVIAVFPYAFSEAVVMLFIASCASRLAMDDSDVFALLAIAIRDLFFSPLSCLLLILFYALVWTDLVTHWAILLKAPLLATLLGHGVYSLIAMLWALGGLHSQGLINISDSELNLV